MQANGDIYDGYWKNDMRHGTGIKKYCNNDYYSGEWSEDIK